jgi:hypothetical protein
MLTTIQLNDLALRLARGLNDPTIITKISNNSTYIIKTYNNSVSSNVTGLGNNTINASKASGIVNNLNIKSGLVQNSQVATILQSNSSDVVTTADTQLVSIIQTTIPEYSQDQISAVIGPQVSDISLNSVVNSITEFTTNLFSGNPLSSLFDSISSTLSGIYDSIAAQFTSGISSRAKQYASKYNINSNSNQSKLSNVRNGFSDPTATYPTSEYANRPDTNKLATGDLNGTIVVQKEKDRLVGAKLPGGGKWEMPTSSYNAKYPYNSVMQTESGHIVEFDDTPGSERINIHHKSGSYLEIDPNGTTIQRSKSSQYDIIDKNHYISIGGTANLAIGSTANVYVNGDLNVEVAGDIAIRGDNDIGINAGGRLQLSANEGVDIHSTDIKIEADNELHILADVKAFITAEVLRILSNQDIAIQAKTDINVKADNIITQVVTNISNKAENILMQSNTDTSIKSGGLALIESGSDTSIKAGGNFVWDSGGLTLGEQGSSQAAKDAADAQNSEPAVNAENGIGGQRVDFVGQDIPEPQSRNFLDEYATYVETSKDNYSKLRNTLVTQGLVDIKILDKTPIIADSTGVTYNGMEVTQPTAVATTSTVIPDNYQLSPHFTLASLTTKTGLHHSALVAQAGLTYNEILANLQLLSINILEPLYAVYPDLEVIDAFNTINDYQVDSEHYTGNAVDIQFRDKDVKDYYNLAVEIAKIIPYNVLTLNYSDYSNKPWIHISLNANNNQGITETWYNNKKISSDLSNLT